jgi:hypothetical protein
VAVKAALDGQRTELGVLPYGELELPGVGAASKEDTG